MNVSATCRRLEAWSSDAAEQQVFVTFKEWHVAKDLLVQAALVCVFALGKIPTGLCQTELIEAHGGDTRVPTTLGCFVQDQYPQPDQGSNGKCSRWF